MARRNPRSTGFVAAKIRQNTARRNGSDNDNDKALQALLSAESLEEFFSVDVSSLGWAHGEYQGLLRVWKLENTCLKVCAEKEAKLSKMAQEAKDKGQEVYAEHLETLSYLEWDKQNDAHTGLVVLENKVRNFQTRWSHGR